MLAHVQSARRAWRNLGDGAGGLHRPRSQARARRRRGIPRNPGGRCRRCCLRSAPRSCRPPRAERPRLSCPSSRAHTSGRRRPIDDLPERTADEWVKGPPEDLRERAAAGFAKKHGVAVDELELRDGFLGLTVPGRALREVLPEQIDRIVRGFSFTKSMRWDGSGIRFARPVRWVLAKLDAETIVGETSFGHRFTHGAVEIPTAAAYADALRAADVEPVAEERRRLIVDGLDTIGGWSDPGGKLAEVIQLVEKPIVLESR
ncbi:MAG: glycine--tRNA ligase subunit beta, partial [Actinobacteria bacterium]